MPRPRKEYPLFEKYIMRNVYVRNSLIEFLRKLNEERSKNKPEKVKGEKFCRRCENTFPFTEEFFLKKGGRLYGCCIPCQKIINREIYKRCVAKRNGRADREGCNSPASISAEKQI